MKTGPFSVKLALAAVLASVLASAAGIALAQSSTGYADETADFGIIATKFPRSRTLGYGTPTPTTIPGAKVITTDELVSMLGADPKPAVLVAYNAKGVIPGAQIADGAGEDRLLGLDLDKFTRLLAAASGGDKGKPLVFYCHSAKCWLSYNASLHALEAGYTNVYWYRGGRDAWKAAGRKFRKPAGSAANAAGDADD